MEGINKENNEQVFQIKKQDLFEKIRNFKHDVLDEDIKNIIHYLQEKTNCKYENLQLLIHKVTKFKFILKSKWAQSQRKRERFLEQHRSWLQSNLVLPFYPPTVTITKSKKIGRPTRDFEFSSECSKRRKTSSLRTYSTNVLAYSTQMNLRASGNIEAAKIIKDITSSSSKANMYREALQKCENLKIVQVTKEEALSLITEAKLTRHQYEIIQKKDKQKFPCYSVVQKAKSDCYPDQQSIFVSDTTAQIKLQALLDHTTARLLESIQEVLEFVPEYNFTKIFLISKWGIDGTNATEYKQNFENESQSDTSLFFTSLVPVQLYEYYPDINNKRVLWQNPRPGSTRYCRPIRFSFERETVHSTKTEKERMDIEIKNLTPSIFISKGHKYYVTHLLRLTMIDCKICNALTDNKSTQRCYVCNLTTKDFNNIEKCLQAETKVEYFEFGLSVLHAWIRFMECLLHVSYKLPIKKNQARTPEEKDIVTERKRQIQIEFKKQLSLLVDKPKQGFGNTNDGNTARRFFQNKNVSARITGIDENVFKRFHVILTTVSCEFEIDTEKFDVYCLDTAKLFVKNYSWYQMPPTVHKLLIHDSKIIQYALLPIGQLSEEAQEARNKDIKKYRRDYSRKCSRINTNEDVLNNLLISSDPLITSLRKLPHKNIKNLEKDIQNLLKPPKLPIENFD